MTLYINPDTQTRVASADKECPYWALSNNTVHIVKDLRFFKRFLPHKSTILDRNGKSYKVEGVGMVCLTAVLPFEKDLTANRRDIELIDAVWVPDAPCNIIGARQPHFESKYELRSARTTGDVKEPPITFLLVRRQRDWEDYIFVASFHCHPGAEDGCLKVLRTSMAQGRRIIPLWDFAPNTWALARPAYGGFVPFSWPLEETIKVERVKAEYGVETW